MMQSSVYELAVPEGNKNNLNKYSIAWWIVVLTDADIKPYKSGSTVAAILHCPADIISAENAVKALKMLRIASHVIFKHKYSTDTFCIALRGYEDDSNNGVCWNQKMGFR